MAPFIWTEKQELNAFGFLAANAGSQARSDGVNRWFLFRRKLELPEPCAHAPISVTVDGRYKLFVNGAFVGRGPIRANPHFQRYDRYDLAPFLREGTNVIAVIIHTYGVDTAFYETVKGMWAETFGDGGLWVEGEAQMSTRTLPIRTDYHWRCWTADAWNSRTSRMNMGLGFIEELDGRLLPEGWMTADFDDKSWDKVQELIAGGGGADSFFGGMETRPFPTLIERAIPPLSETLTAPARFARANGLESRPRIPLESRSYSEPFTELPAQAITNMETLCRQGGSDQGRARVTTQEAVDIALLFDFGRLVTGYPFIEIDAKGGEIIDIAVAERLPGEYDAAGIAANARITPQPTIGLDAHVARYVCRPGRQRFERFEWSAIKWMQVSIRNAPDGIDIRSLGANVTNYPVEAKGAFQSSDPFLDRLWSVGAYTLRQCMHDAWEDCPSREQRQWLGDATIEHLVGQAAFGPDVSALNALFLRQAAESQRTDGLTQMYAPGDHKTNGLLIPDWTLQWILNAGDHWRYSGDLDTIDAIFPSIEKALAWFERHRSPSGLIADIPFWHFMDWAAVGRRGEACTLNALYAGCLDVTAHLSQAIGNARKAGIYHQRAAQIRQALHARHWDGRRGVYVDCVDPRSGAQEKRVSQHANAAMILWGEVPSDRLDTMLARICDPARLVFTPAPPITSHWADFDAEENVVLANTFFAHFVYSALAQCGRLRDALAMMRQRLGPMIEAGSSTLWESLEPSASLCHGFSASPTFQLSTNLLGIRPAEPGFGRAIWSPDLCDLEQASGRIETPQGPVLIRLAKTQDGFEGFCDAPESIQILVQPVTGWRQTKGPQSFHGRASIGLTRT